MITANKKDVVRERISILITYWVGLDKQAQTATTKEGKVFLEFEIEELMDEYFGIKKEAAADQGDYNFDSFEKLVAFSIPAWETESKGFLTRN